MSLVASDVRMISSEPFMGTQSSSFFVSLESCVGIAGIWKIFEVNIPQMNLADKFYNSYHIYIVGLFIEISLLEGPTCPSCGLHFIRVNDHPGSLTVGSNIWSFTSSRWGFPKMVVHPQIIHFNKVFHYFFTIHFVGTPIFWKHPNKCLVVGSLKAE